MKATTEMVAKGAAAQVVLLCEAGLAGGAGERVAGRLSAVQAIFADDLRAIEQELAQASADGVTPATDSALHLVNGGGKRVRPLALLLAAACFGPVPSGARELAVVAELVHTATLLHDDVIDDGRERRGRPTSRTLWGNAVSVLAGDLLLTHALERASLAAPPHARERILAELFATLRRLVDGEVVQLRGRAKLDVTEATYFRVIRDKTASLFVWSARAGAIVAGGPADAVDALGAFGEHLGTAFQLVDDALDYGGDARATGKAVLADLGEGKLTLPLIRALARFPELAPDLAAAREGAVAAAERLAQAVRSSGACDEVRAIASNETASALAALRSLPLSPARQLLEAVAAELVSRPS